MTSSPGQHHFDILDSEVLLDAPIIAVRRDTLRMPGGGTGKREIVEHFGAVAVVAFDGANIALVHQYRHSVQRRLWELPAGILDIADEDPLVCAQRELTEEAGLAAKQWGLLTDLVCSPGFCEEGVRIFFAQDLSEVPQPDADDEEADMQLTWVALEEAKNMVLRGEIANSIAIAGIMIAADLVAREQEPRPVTDPFDLRPTSLSARRKAAGLGADMKRV